MLVINDQSDPPVEENDALQDLFELIQTQGHELHIIHTDNPCDRSAGYIHLALSVGSEERVDTLIARLSADGYKVLDGPRRTGDGYHESAILGPENNMIEITVLATLHSSQK